MTLEDLFSGTRSTSGRLTKSAAFSPDGKYLIIGYGDGTARVWDIALMQVTRELRGHADQVRTVAFNAEGDLILTGSDDGDARAWDLESGQTLFLFHGHSNVPAAVFSADGQRVLTTDRRGIVRS